MASFLWALLLTSATGASAFECYEDPDYLTSGGSTCEDYTDEMWCTSSGDYGAGWNMSTWGTFADYVDANGVDPTEACCGCGGGSCQDNPLGWQSSGGSTCADYADGDWCTRTGGYGDGWNVSAWGTFDQYAADGIDPTQACCVCGAGSLSTTVMGCNDAPDGWTSSGGSTCGAYTDGDWCTYSGGYGSGWNVSEWGTFDEYQSAAGVDALTACCGCGGGSCQDTPNGWMSSSGYDCAAYIGENWCTSSGNYGSAWEASWGAFSDYPSIDGTSANEACCGCGGGDNIQQCMSVSTAIANNLGLVSCGR